MLRILNNLVRRVAMRTGRLRGTYLRLCHPRGEEYAEFLRRHGGLYSIGERCAILPGALITDPKLTRIRNNVLLPTCALIGHDGSIAMLNRAYNLKLDAVGESDIRGNGVIGYGAIVLPNVT